MSPTESRRNRRVIVYVVLGAATVVAVWLIGQNSINNTRAFARSLCLNVAASRKQGNARADVIRTFLVTAARARAASAELERTKNPKQAAADTRTARLYLDLANRVHPVPAPPC